MRIVTSPEKYRQISSSERRQSGRHDSSITSTFADASTGIRIDFQAIVPGKACSGPFHDQDLLTSRQVHKSTQKTTRTLPSPRLKILKGQSVQVSGFT
jgi:hypothetical protein